MNRTDGRVDPPVLEVHRDVVGLLPVLLLAGECDLATRDLLAAELRAAIGAEPLGLILDLTRVTFCDAGFVSQVMSVGRSIRVAVVGVDGGLVGRVLGILDPGGALPRYHTVADAAWGLSSSIA